MSWDSEQYLKFKNERKQPCLDLLTRLNGEYNTILDLGCGPGNSTKNLSDKFQNSEIIGIDSDENMLERARSEHPEFNFIKGFAPECFADIHKKFDLIFSNACIHWIPDQQGLISGVYDLLNDNGTFAVQIPLTEESQFYKILYEMIDSDWSELKETKEKLRKIKNFKNLSASGYYNALTKKFKDVEIWRTDYHHLAEDADTVLEWYKGSGLRPYLARLDENEQEDFLTSLRTIIERRYEKLHDGKMFLIMPRLFFIAMK